MLISKSMIKQYIIAIVLLIVGLYGLNYYLEDFTKHGEVVTVPDLKGLSLEEVAEMLESRGLRFIVEDSSYVKGKAHNVVLDQNPLPNFKVKDQRTIYLEINSSAPPKVALPNLVDLTLRMALNQIQVLGLKQDKLEYRPDIGKDVILGVKYEGKRVDPGFKLIKGSKISFIVGAGQGSQKSPIPNLHGLSLDEATELLFEHSLNVGNINYDSTVVDTVNARIFLQRPLDTLKGGIINQLKLGDFVDVWITQEILPDSTESILLNDSTISQ